MPTLSLHLTSEQSLYKRATNLIARKWALITSPILTSFKEASHSSPRLALLKYFLLFSQAKNLQLCLPCPPPHLIFMPHLIYKHTGDIFPLKGLSSLPSLQCLGTNPIHWLAVSTALPEFMVEKQILSFFIYLSTYLDLNAFYMSFLPVSHFLFFPCLFLKKSFSISPL